MKQKSFISPFVVVVVSIAIVFISFIIWMNATPGHFQGTCSCGLEYITNEKAEGLLRGLCPYVGACIETPVNSVLNNILYTSSKLDFYK